RMTPASSHPSHTRRSPMTIHHTRRHLLGALGAGSLALGAAACGSSDPFAEEDGQGEGGSDGGGDAGSGGIAIGSQAYYSNELIARSEEHTSGLQPRFERVCSLTLEKQ